MKVKTILKKIRYCKHLTPVTKEAYEEIKNETCSFCHRPFKPYKSIWQEILGIDSLE